MNVAANGLRFHVAEQGDGPPVLLLHGFPDTGDVWRRQLPVLANAGLRAIAPDLRGRGRSERPEGVEAYAMPELVADAVGLLDTLGVERAHVVGHDWGAVVAWALAALVPERVDRLVAMSVGFPGAVRPDRRALEQAWYRLVFLFPEAEEVLRRDDWFLFRILFEGAPDAERYLADLSDPAALTAGLDWYRANLPVGATPGADRPRLPRIQAATLGVFGVADRYLTERAMVASEAYVDGPWRYERVDGAGHWLQLEQPDRVNELLLEFLSRPS
ncbi:MAG TPA: alpha/beta hydrolase [Gaiellaceae bacterium]|nr:alpha/beta hydrolase [Gaiellaceae bacterium]